MSNLDPLVKLFLSFSLAWFFSCHEGQGCHNCNGSVYVLWHTTVSPNASAYPFWLSPPLSFHPLMDKTYSLVTFASNLWPSDCLNNQSDSKLWLIKLQSMEAIIQSLTLFFFQVCCHLLISYSENKDLMHTLSNTNYGLHTLTQDLPCW